MGMTEASRNWMCFSRVKSLNSPSCPVKCSVVFSECLQTLRCSLEPCGFLPVSLLCPQVPVQPPGAAEGMGAEHRPGQLQAQAAHGHLLRALPTRVLQCLWKPQKPEAECRAHGVRLSGRRTAGEGERGPGRRGCICRRSQGGGERAQVPPSGPSPWCRHRARLGCPCPPAGLPCFVVLVPRTRVQDSVFS